MSDETKAAVESIAAAFAAWPSEFGAICDRVSAAVRAEAYGDTVESLAREIEAIIARQGSMQEEDLLTLGWSKPALVETLPDALETVRARASRHLS
ncbi:hypothetical protein [Ancylobacter polymorphus]|uniref:Uncharacterized protein n=1 Tax=Ancylobacter polymorphus TaxID=223390 RepID=A0A9E7A558_9HYPH|nr:hypothetical protein [Ancylobacter polymorphus]UOK72988.1 hypothetical protein K9D25_09960 [Ancylobacter polymorphus]